MLSELKQLFQAAWQLQDNRHDGDALLRKIDSLGGPSDPELEAKLEALDNYLLRVDLEALRQLPDGTLGREYARYMDDRELEPVDISPEVEDIAHRNAFATRYLLVHDLLHLLTGFADNSYAGEIGLLAFSVAQGYGEEQEQALEIAKVLYPLLASENTEVFEACANRGEEMGQEARFVIGYPFQENWDRPLDEVRSDLRLQPMNGRNCA